MRNIVAGMLLLLLTVSAGSTSQTGPQRPVHTYSIVARDPATGNMGVAVQSHWFSVGSVVPWAEAGVGAVATQSLVNVSFGPRGLALLRDGMKATAVLDSLIAADEGRDVRQLAVIDAHGGIAAYTGERCIPEAGHHVGNGYSVQANLMHNDRVVPSMAKAFEKSTGSLARRMISALEAAERAGGDIRGKQSAAILVVRGEPTGSAWLDRIVDLRVEDHPEPVKELSRLLDLWRAYDYMNRGDLAMEKNDVAGALDAYRTAEEMFPDNLEMKYWHAVSLANAGFPDEALPIFAEIFAKDENWRTLTKRLPAAGFLDIEGEGLERILESDGAGARRETDRKDRGRMPGKSVEPAPFAGGAVLLVVNKNDDEVAFVDIGTGDVRGKVKTGPNPHEIAVTPDGKLGYVPNYGSGRPEGERSWLTVIDIESMGAVRDLELRDPTTGAYLGAPHGIAITPDGGSMWVTAEGSGSVARISLPDERVTNVYPTEQDVSHMVAVLPDGSKAYVTNIGSGSVSVVDVSTGTVSVIACEAGAEGIDITPDGRSAWVTNRAANSISVIDTEKDEVVDRLEAGRFPIRLAFTPDGKYALVSNAVDGEIAAYDVPARKQVRTIPSGNDPIGILIAPDGNHAYVANTASDRLSILDLRTWEITGSIEPGDNPDGMAISRRQGALGDAR